MDLKLRPILDCRLPTLGTRVAFLLPIDEMPTLRKKMSGMKSLETAPPRTLKDLRQILNSEIKAMTKKISRMERAFYGVGGTMQDYVDKYLEQIKSVMKSVYVFELCSEKSVETAIQRGDESQYKANQDDIDLLKEAYTKMQTYIPDKFRDIVAYCHKIVETLERYCVSFYNSEQDGYLETADHYEKQIQTWKNTIRDHLHNIDKIYNKFCGTGLHASNFTSTVMTFCEKHHLGTVPFLLMFADACSNIKGALTIMTTWLKADENYAEYIKNDIVESEKLREDREKRHRDAGEKFHTLTFRLNQVEQDWRNAHKEDIVFARREELFKSEEEYVLSRTNELKNSLENMEFKKKDLKKKFSELPQEVIDETYSNMSNELRIIKERLPVLERQLVAVRYKLDWVHDKRKRLQRSRDDIENMRKDLKEAKCDREKYEKEFTTLEKSLEVARRIYLFKTANDAVEKIYYNLPVGLRESKLSGFNKSDENFDKGCQIVSDLVGTDWVNFYRNLPFYPPRGTLTIERDINSFRSLGARDPTNSLMTKCLQRWRRFHTRANVHDLIKTCKIVRRFDMAHELHLVLNPPKVEEDEEEEVLPPVPFELIPFYRQVEKYDQLVAENKI